jgi:NAD(P)-dependent dehydrogenase (short-subunit alcohol dehydrogenase family)
MASKKTVIVTGASQGIGAAIVQAFLDRGYNVVATSRSASTAGFAPSPNLALVDGDICQAATAEKITQTAIAKFGSIDHVVNNAGIFSAKPFTDYTIDEFAISSLSIWKDSSSSPNAQSSRCCRKVPAAA